MNHYKKLTQRIHTLTRSPTSFLAYTLRGAHSTPGDCCKIRDQQIQKCRTRVMKTCKPLVPEKSCYSRAEMYTKALSDYPKQLLRVLRGEEKDCEIIRHDKCYYQPSDKNRRYQRTWCECPFIWLRPKKICCYEKEVCPPAPRRQRQPVLAKKLTPQELHKQHMNQLCKTTCRVGSKPQKKCIYFRPKAKCEKVKTPFPSFSECDQRNMRQHCEGECNCSLLPSKCEIWREFHKNKSLLKKCTEAIARKCGHKWHSIGLY